jgi:uncharacterized protein DUF481
MKSATRLHPFLTLLPFLFLWLALTAPSLSARSKIDVLVMKNGDRITCEIRALEKGQLKIKTSYTVGTIPVDWTEVERIESKQFFNVEMTNGASYTGVIELLPNSEDTGKDFRISTDVEEDEVSQGDVVLIEQLEKSWRSNLDGRIDVGFGYTKSNSTTDLTLNAGLDYKTKKRYLSNKFSSTIRRQKKAADTNRNNFTTSLFNRMKGHWFNAGLFDLLQSDEQQLDLRTTIGGGVGRYLIHTNRTTLGLLGGLVFARESYSQAAGIGSEKQNNVEALVAVNFSLYRFDSSQITFNSRVFPSISTPGRVRIDNDISFKLDLWGDLYWNFSLWQNLDSQPPVNVANTDYGVSTNIGWSF